ncbi:MAG: class I SAM-dependent methyltransferase [Cyclobacteriaceae bacterium]|nr:class I SAM-dependent methyltransferase [Cyclobacteriaceae bacterium]UYN87377.1 MAG: class I SAM-dependent methyltransferase [Cyclobacteriaceae bacterium]
MKKFLRVLKPLAPFFEVLLLPITITSIVWFRISRYWGLKSTPLTRALFLKLGMYPVVDHYYDPLFDYRKLHEHQPKARFDFNIKNQLNLISSFSFREELSAMPLNSPDRQSLKFYYENGSFGSGDAEFYYSLIRLIKPKRIIEVGSGFSTRAALAAVEENTKTDLAYTCKITCIEPYEMPWLEQTGVNLLRTKVEELSPEFFDSLESGDILFIDSSHIIRPGGDVVTIILDLLPRLKSGVYVHFHDIFIPDDYPVAWLRDDFRMWNEQYILEAFMINNNLFEVICMMNFLTKNHYEALKKVFPVLEKQPDRVPGSFWIRRK